MRIKFPEYIFHENLYNDGTLWLEELNDAWSPAIFVVKILCLMEDVVKELTYKEGMDVRGGVCDVVRKMVVDVVMLGGKVESFEVESDCFVKVFSVEVGKRFGKGGYLLFGNIELEGLRRLCDYGLDYDCELTFIAV